MSVRVQFNAETEFFTGNQLRVRRWRSAGRRGTVGETFVEKNTGYWGPGRGDMRIKHWRLECGQDCNWRHPLGRITVQVLAHGLRLSALGSDSVGNCQSEGTSRQANAQPADGKGNNEDKPASMLVIRESQVL